MFLLFLFFFAITALAVESTSTGEVETAAPIHVIGEAVDRPSQPSEAFGHSTSVEALSGTPSLERVLTKHSVSVRAAGGEGVATQFLIRGQDPGQSRFFLEGIPLTDAEYNVSRSYWLPLEMIGQVDVYAGAIPSRYGEDGLGGAVEMRLRENMAPWLVSVRGGSLGYAKGLLRAEVEGKQNGVLLSYSRSNEDFRYFDDNGTPSNPADDTFRDRTHNRFMRVTAFPRAVLVSTAKHRLQTWALVGSQKLEAPGSIRMPSRAEYDETWTVAALQHRWRGETREHRSSAYFRGAWESLHMDATGRVGLNLPGDTSAWSIGVQSSNEPLSKEGIAVSAGVRWHQFSRTATDSQVPYQRSDIPISVWGRFGSNELSVTPALLAHHYGYFRSATPEKGYLLASPRASLEWNAGENWRFRGSVGRFYRAPTLNEIYGTSMGLVESRDLRPEFAWKAEVGADWSLRPAQGAVNRIAVSYTGYFSRAEDLVTFIQTSQDARRATNLSVARILGHELATEISFRWGVRLESSLQFLQAVNLSPISYQQGRDLPYRPALRANLGVEVERGRWSFYYRAAIQGKSYSDLGNLQELAPLTDHSLGAGFRSPGLGQFSLEVSNLSDVLTTSVKSGGFSFSEVASGYLGYPIPGRRIYLSWKLEV